MSDHKNEGIQFVCLTLRSRTVSAQTLGKDTVTADKEDDKVDAHHHVGEDRPSIRHDAVVHHGVPVLSSENLRRGTIKEDKKKEGDTCIHNLSEEGCKTL